MDNDLSPSYLAESRSSTVKGVMWVMAIVPLAFVLMRLYVRVLLRRVFGWDDFIIIIAIVSISDIRHFFMHKLTSPLLRQCCLVGYAAVSHVASTLGLGRHLAVVAQNPDHLIQVALLCDIGEALAIMACTLGKTSFAVTLLRIVVHRWMIVLLWFVIVTMNLINVLAALFIFVQCKDPRHLWNPAIPSKCWPPDVFTHFSLFVGGMSYAAELLSRPLPQFRVAFL